MLQHQNSLDHRDDPTRPFCMTDVGLHRAHEEGVLGGPSLTKHGMYCRCLERVSHFRPCPMSLDVAGVNRIHPGIAVGAPHQGCLRHGVGRGNASRAAILVDTGVDSQCADDIAVVQCILVWLQDHTTHSFTATESRGLVVEGIASSAVREHSAVFR